MTQMATTNRHVVELGHLEIGVPYHRILDLGALGLFDVDGPFAVVLDRIDRESDQLGIALGEFRLDLGHVAELGRADRREILGMRKQDRPLVADPLMVISPL